MSLSYDLLQLSFQNNSTIEKVKQALTAAAASGDISTEVYSIEQEDVEIIVAYLKDQGFRLWNYNKFGKVLFVSWV